MHFIYGRIFNALCIFIIEPSLSACGFSFTKFNNKIFAQLIYTDNIIKKQDYCCEGKLDNEINVPEINETRINYRQKKTGTMSFFCLYSIE